MNADDNSSINTYAPMLDLGEDCSHRSMVKHYGSDSNARQLNVQLLRKIAVPRNGCGGGGNYKLVLSYKKIVHMCCRRSENYKNVMYKIRKLYKC